MNREYGQRNITRVAISLATRTLKRNNISVLLIFQRGELRAARPS